MAYKDPEQGRARDRERFRRRAESRRARGLCPRCGERPPEPGRSLCEPCAEKQREASRARDAKLRAAGKPRRDPERARVYERERHRRQTAERIARGLCPKCGKLPPASGHSLCELCGEKRRAAERARYAEARARGELYGGRDPDRRRRLAREKGGRRRPPVQGGTACEPCRDAQRAAEREQYAARRAAGLCVGCGEPAFDGEARCGPCAMRKASRTSPERKNAAARRRYARRRAKGKCTDCGQSAQGAARCEPCARRSYERSDHFRGIPIWQPQYTVIELATGEDHGTYDSEADVALCLAFAKLSRDQVEILADISPLATLTSWS